MAKKFLTTIDAQGYTKSGLGFGEPALCIPVDDHVSSVLTAWVITNHFVFPGSSVFNVKNFDVVTWITEITDGQTAEVRIYDSTNSAVIVSITGITDIVETVQTTSTFSNVPTGRASFEMQIRKQGAGAGAVQYSGGLLR